MDKKLRPSIFKRLLALLVDFIILGIIGFTSGLFLEDFYVSLAAALMALGPLIPRTTAFENAGGNSKDTSITKFEMKNEQNGTPSNHQT